MQFHTESSDRGSWNEAWSQQLVLSFLWNKWSSGILFSSHLYKTSHYSLQDWPLEWCGSRNHYLYRNKGIPFYFTTFNRMLHLCDCCRDYVTVQYCERLKCTSEFFSFNLLLNCLEISWNLVMLHCLSCSYVGGVNWNIVYVVSVLIIMVHNISTGTPKTKRHKWLALHSHHSSRFVP